MMKVVFEMTPVLSLFRKDGILWNWLSQWRKFTIDRFASPALIQKVPNCWLPEKAVRKEIVQDFARRVLDARVRAANAVADADASLSRMRAVWPEWITEVETCDAK